MEDELDIVKQLADSIDSNAIIIISDFNKMNRMKAIINRKQIASPYFIYRPRIPIPIEHDPYDLASFFVLDEGLYTQFVYKAGGDQSIGNAYFKRIIRYFNSNNN